VIVALQPTTFVALFTLLFFFWVYGIASFVLDVKHKLVPAVRRYVAARGESRGESRRESTTDDESRAHDSREDHLL